MNIGRVPLHIASMASEYHSFIPPDSSNFDQCNNGTPSEDLWDKFDFDLLTPPHSPEQAADVCASYLNCDNICSDYAEDLTSQDLCDPLLSDNCDPLPDLKDTIGEYFETCSSSIVTKSKNNIRQDCMWNGRNEPRQSLSHRRSRSNSPVSLSGSLGSGCIDPESLFNSYRYSTDCIRTISPRRLKPENGLETPSDSGKFSFSKPQMFL